MVPDLVRGDRHRIEHVLGNLLGNAIKFSPEDSEVEVDVSVVAGDRGKVQANLVLKVSTPYRSCLNASKPVTRGDKKCPPACRAGCWAWYLSGRPSQTLPEFRPNPPGPAAERCGLRAGADYRQAHRGAARRPNRSRLHRRTRQLLLLLHPFRGGLALPSLHHNHNNTTAPVDASSQTGCGCGCLLAGE